MCAVREEGYGSRKIDDGPKVPDGVVIDDDGNAGGTFVSARAQPFRVAAFGGGGGLISWGVDVD